MINVDIFKQVMRNFVSGVSIVTAMQDGLPQGMTATSFAAVSVEPPLILISLERNSRTFRAVDSSGRFAVNILSHDQADVAIAFATPAADRFADRFKDGSFSLSASGLPILGGTLGALECEVSDKMRGGDHEIFLGMVSQGGFTAGEPLLYFQQRYRQIREE